MSGALVPGALGQRDRLALRAFCDADVVAPEVSSPVLAEDAALSSPGRRVRCRALRRSISILPFSTSTVNRCPVVMPTTNVLALSATAWTIRSPFTLPNSCNGGPRRSPIPGSGRKASPGKPPATTRPPPGPLTQATNLDLPQQTAAQWSAPSTIPRSKTTPVTP